MSTAVKTDTVGDHRLRVAIVHDALVNAGGAERTVVFMCETFPGAELFTSVYLPDLTYPDFRLRRVHVLPGARRVSSERRAKQLFLVWILGFRRLDLSGFDVVITSTTFGAKYARPPAAARHACYCYAPFRLLWKPGVYSPDSLPLQGAAGALAGVVRPLLKRLDYRVMQTIPSIATTCRNMAAEIRNCYGRDARVIHPPIRIPPPVDATGTGDYYLTVSRLMSHKRIDLAINACERLQRSLVIVGDGPERRALEAMTGSGIRFAGRVPDDTLADLYRRCRAVLFPSHEDYGLVPLEAQAHGRPVIAFGAGGVLETVIEHETGVFFREQTVEAVVDAIQRFERSAFDPAMIRRHAERFSIPRFADELRAFVLGPPAGLTGSADAR